MGFAKAIFEFFHVLKHTIIRDCEAISFVVKILCILLISKIRNDTLATKFLNFYKKHPKKVAFISDEEKWTYEDIYKFGNQLCNYISSFNYTAKDNCALFLPSMPLHPVTWFSLSRIGIPSALINEHLRKDSLVQAIKASNCSFIIFNDDLAEAMEEVYDSIKSNKIRVFGYRIKRKLSFEYFKLEEEMCDYSSKELMSDFKGTLKDIVCYIYTSGTTGLPKAAIMRQSRMFFCGFGSQIVLSLTKDDIIYNPFPLYHSLGSSILLTPTFLCGNTNVLRRKFSAKQFWDDCIKYDCTVSGYIGEMTRYLLAQPERPTDRAHRVTKMIGVGLRENVWQKFMDRFGIKKIVEIYGSTEGNANLVNFTGRVGACGYVPVLLPDWLNKRLPIPRLILFDDLNGEPIRGPDGLCILAKANETGMLMAEIANSAISHFDGYLDQESTKKKIIRNVLRDGDAYFASYDILRIDKYGYLYFQDRLGDTFRWRGENVSTNQVESILGAVLNLVECSVFGVEIPGNEGKAGMAAINSPSEINFEFLYKSLNEKLPKYAIPVFIRVAKQIEITCTFKFNKVKLKKESFDINSITDPIYIIDNAAKTYRKLDQKTHDDIINKRLRL